MVIQAVEIARMPRVSRHCFHNKLFMTGLGPGDA
jgi:hypothetical protein